VVGLSLTLLGVSKSIVIEKVLIITILRTSQSILLLFWKMFIFEYFCSQALQCVWEFLGVSVSRGDYVFVDPFDGLAGAMLGPLGYMLTICVLIGTWYFWIGRKFESVRIYYCRFRSWWLWTYGFSCGSIFCLTGILSDLVRDVWKGMFFLPSYLVDLWYRFRRFCYNCTNTEWLRIHFIEHSERGTRIFNFASFLLWRFGYWIGSIFSVPNVAASVSTFSVSSAAAMFVKFTWMQIITRFSIAFGVWSVSYYYCRKGVTQLMENVRNNYRKANLSDNPWYVKFPETCFLQIVNASFIMPSAVHWQFLGFILVALSGQFMSDVNVVAFALILSSVYLITAPWREEPIKRNLPGGGLYFGIYEWFCKWDWFNWRTWPAIFIHVVTDYNADLGFLVHILWNSLIVFVYIIPNLFTLARGIVETMEEEDVPQFQSKDLVLQSRQKEERISLLHSRKIYKEDKACIHENGFCIPVSDRNTINAFLDAKNRREKNEIRDMCGNRKKLQDLFDKFGMRPRLRDYFVEVFAEKVLAESKCNFSHRAELQSDFDLVKLINSPDCKQVIQVYLAAKSLYEKRISDAVMQLGVAFDLEKLLAYMKWKKEEFLDWLASFADTDDPDKPVDPTDVEEKAESQNHEEDTVFKEWERTVAKMLPTYVTKSKLYSRVASLAVALIAMAYIPTVESTKPFLRSLNSLMDITKKLTIVGLVFSIINTIREGVMKYYSSGDFRDFFVPIKEIAIQREMRELCYSRHALREGIIHLEERVAKTEKLIKESDYITNHDVGILRLKLNQQLEKDKMTLVSQRLRKMPFPVVIVGNPGVGKSVLQEAVKAVSAVVNGHDPQEQGTTLTWDINVKYNSAPERCLGVVFNDIPPNTMDFTKTDRLPPEVIFQQVIDHIPVAPRAASIEDKNNFICPEFVYITSNDHSHKHSTDPSKLKRRFGLGEIYEMYYVNENGDEMQPDQCTKLDDAQRTNATRFAPMRVEVSGTHLTYRRYNYLEPPRATNGITMTQFLKQLESDMIDHKRKQEEKIKRLTDAAQRCSCGIPRMFHETDGENAMIGIGPRCNPVSQANEDVVVVRSVEQESRVAFEVLILLFSGGFLGCRLADSWNVFVLHLFLMFLAVVTYYSKCWQGGHFELFFAGISGLFSSVWWSPTVMWVYMPGLGLMPLLAVSGRLVMSWSKERWSSMVFLTIFGGLSGLLLSVVINLMKCAETIKQEQVVNVVVEVTEKITGVRSVKVEYERFAQWIRKTWPKLLVTVSILAALKCLNDWYFEKTGKDAFLQSAQFDRSKISVPVKHLAPEHYVQYNGERPEGWKKVNPVYVTPLVKGVAQEDLITKIKANMLELVFSTVNGKPCSSHVLKISQTRFIVNYHVIAKLIKLEGKISGKSHKDIMILVSEMEGDVPLSMSFNLNVVERKLDVAFVNSPLGGVTKFNLEEYLLPKYVPLEDDGVLVFPKRVEKVVITRARVMVPDPVVGDYEVIGYEHTYNSKPGDCGSVLCANISGSWVIIGIHSYGFATKGIGGACAINYNGEPLKDYFPKINDVVIAENGVVLGPLSGKSHLFEAEKSRDLLIHGSSGTKNGPMKTSIEETIWHSYFEPRISKRFSPPIKAAGMLDGEFRSAFLYTLDNINAPSFFDTQILEEVVDAYVERMEQAIKLYRIKGGVLSYEGAINGVEGTPIGSSPLNTATGPSWKRYKDKWEMFTESPLGTYTLNDDVCKALDANEEILDNFCVPAVRVSASVKDELREKSKVEAFKLRIFGCLDTDDNWTSAKYLKPIIAFFLSFPYFSRVFGGMNAMSGEWNDLYKALVRLVNIIEMDFIKFDVSHLLQIVFFVAKMIYRVAIAMGYSEPDAHKCFLLVLAEFFDSREHNGDHFFKTKGLVSGALITLLINSLINIFLFMYAFRFLSRERGLNYRMRDFFSLVFNGAVGDDSIGAVSDEIKEWYNMLSLVDVFKLVGYEATAGDKGKVQRPFIPISEAKFLKRGFRWSAELQQFVAPLEKDSIYKGLCWQSKNAGVTPKTRLGDVATNALREMFLWGKADFEVLREEVLRLAEKDGIVVRPLVFEELVEEYKTHEFFVWDA